VNNKVIPRHPYNQSSSDNRFIVVTIVFFSWCHDNSFVASNTPSSEMVEFYQCIRRFIQ